MLTAARPWRSPAALETLKAGLEPGTTPRLSGGESGLFLPHEDGADDGSVVPLQPQESRTAQRTYARSFGFWLAVGAAG